MQESPNKFSEHKIYEGIFRIFEQELEEISHFVAFADCNMNVCSNKIHELHLRVCSEVENILKIIIHQHFVSEAEVKELWKNKKSAFLERKGLVSEYKGLKEELDSIVENYKKFEEKYEEIKRSLGQGENSKKKNKEEGKLEKLLYGFPDFAFYLQIASERINLDRKIVNFKSMIVKTSSFNQIKPFTREPDVPRWWTHYNNLKHAKINKYNDCTFQDLIFSMSGLFILMNYLLKYQRDNEPIKNHNYTHCSQRSNIPHYYVDTSFFYFHSNLFEASVARQYIVWSMSLPLDVNSSDYHSKDIVDLKYPISISAYSSFCNHDNQTLKNLCLKSFNHADRSTNVQESIFYTYVDYQNFTTNDGTEFWRMQHYARFSN